MRIDSPQSRAEFDATLNEFYGDVTLDEFYGADPTLNGVTMKFALGLMTYDPNIYESWFMNWLNPPTVQNGTTIMRIDSPESRIAFDQMIDTLHAPVTIQGVTLTPSNVLHESDPHAYRCAYLDWLDAS